jgi:LysR family transcriptional activator of dmlA
MPQTDRLGEFAAIVEAGSITAAARALGLPRATLSRRISALEAELGVRLLHRSTRRLVLTPAGEELHQRARRIVAEASEAWEAVRRLDDVPRGLLRVSATDAALGDLFVEFLEEYPEIQLEVQSTPRHVDLIAEGIDVAIRFGPVKDTNLIVRKVANGRQIVVASPEYLDARGVPTRPSHLKDHDCIVGFAGEFAPTRTWPLLAGGAVPVGGRLACNEIRLAARAARRGQGLALLPLPIVSDDLERGTLIHVLGDAVGQDSPVSIVYADREYIQPKVRAFVDRAVPVLREAFGG